MIKLKEVTDDLIFWLKSNVPELGDAARRYKGEFDGAQWNPEFPIAFVKFVTSNDELTLNDGASLIMSYDFDIFVGVEFENASGFESGELAEKVFDKINGQNGTTFSGHDYTVIAKKCAWVKSLGRNEVYKVSIKII